MLSRVAQSLVSLSGASPAPIAPAAVQLWHRGFAFEKGPQQTVGAYDVMGSPN